MNQIKRSLSLLLAAILVLGLLPAQIPAAMAAAPRRAELYTDPAADPPGNPFTDVPEEAFYYLPVLWAVENGITSGMTHDTFGPFSYCNRAQVVTFLWRAAGSPEPQGKQNPFADVSEDTWYTKAVLWAVENGITNGLSADSFGPDAVCNRAQVVTFLWRASGSSDPVRTDNPFADVPDGSFFEKAVLWAFENNVTTGSDAQHFDPLGQCMRAHVVTFLYRSSQIPPRTYTVRFVGNGAAAPDPVEVKAGTLVERPADPLREGWAFAGWYSDPVLTAAYDFTAPVTGDITLYARWETPYLQLTLEPGTYGDHVVNRTVTGAVTGNVPAARITYELSGAYNTTIGEIDPGEAAAFAVDVLLQDGENVLKVTVHGAGGLEVSESVTLTYDSGYVYSTGDRAEEIIEQLILIPAWYGEDPTQAPVGQIVSNVLNLYFHDEVDFEGRCSFCTEVLGGEVVGYLNALDMMQVLLPDPLTSAGAVGYTGDTDLTKITEEELYAYINALTAAHGDVLESVEPEYMLELDEQTLTSNDPWDDGHNDDWWLDIIDAYGAWEYDDYHNSDFLKDTKVAMWDSGVILQHPDLNGHVQRLSEGDTNTAYGHHGTYVAGVMVAEADNGIGIAGVMHNNGLLLDCVQTRILTDIVEASIIKFWLTKSVESGAKVFNLSKGAANLVGSGNSRGPAIEYNVSNTMVQLLEKGFDFVIVQSAGNGNASDQGVDYWYNRLFCSINSSNCHSTEKVSKQDVMDRILVVAAIAKTDDLDKAHLTSWSGGDSGGGELNIIAAPGSSILTTHTGHPVTKDGVTYSDWNDYYTRGPEPNPDKVTLDPYYTYKNGTSLSAPIVAGVCALTWSANAELTGAEVVKKVMETAEATAGNPIAVSGNDILSFTKGGMPIVNAENAVKAAVDSRPDYILRITDQTTGAGVRASATVHLDSLDGPVVGEQAVWHADGDGLLNLSKLPAGFYCIEITAEGYESQVFEAYFQESRLDSLYYDVKLTANGGIRRYPCYVEFTTPRAASLRSAPGRTNSAEIGSTAAGETLSSMVLCENQAGEYWYEVNRGGKLCYLYGADTADHNTDHRDVVLTDPVVPGTLVQGASFSIGGTVTAEHTRINMVSAQVRSESGERLLAASATVNDRRYSLKGSAVDLGLRFGSLQAGTYTYQVHATTINYCTRDGATLETLITPHLLCSVVFTVGGHVCDHGTYLYDQAEHPHYSIYLCSGCGKETADTSRPNYINTCEACRPGRPVLTVSVNADGTAVFTWDDVENITHYALWLLKKDAAGDWLTLEQNDVEVSGASRRLEAGEYCAQLLAYNDRMWEPDGSDYVHTWADPVYFTVAHTSAVIASGVCGDDLTWMLTEDGALTISGVGEMWDYSWKDPSWYEYRDLIVAVYIGEGVTSIGDAAFEKCSSLITIDLPEGLTSIGCEAFYECKSLTAINIPEKVTSIGYFTFGSCSSLRAINLPEGVASIGGGAFADCCSLTSIDLPEELISIGDHAFCACSSLTSIDLPEGLTSISDFAFLDCNSLTKIDLPEGLTSISEYAFANCYSLTEIDLPKGLTSISEYAFRNCSSLTEINFPEGVTSIDGWAFAYCGNLTEITFNGNAPTFGAEVFSAVEATAYYPADNPTWAPKVTQNYGGTITWVPY